MKYLLILTLLAPWLTSPATRIIITEEQHRQTPHFRVETPNATYFIEKQSGGCSSLIDRDGNDWIGFSKTGDNQATNSADSDFRGMPNMVFRGDDNGVGHPGFDVCTTEKVASNQLRVRSHSGKWQFSWTFFSDHAILEVEKADPTRHYWFLYEGPVAGKFSPSSHYWGNDRDGLKTNVPVYRQSNETGLWRWVFFGDRKVKRVLFLAMSEPDDQPDFFGYMGNDNSKGILSDDGMAVFGFGRSVKTTPLLKGTNRFIFGFYEKNLLNKQNLKAFNRFISVATTANH